MSREEVSKPELIRNSGSIILRVRLASFVWAGVGVIGGGLHLDLLAARSLVVRPPGRPPARLPYFVRSLARPSPAQKIDRGFEVDIDVLRSRSPYIRPLDRAPALLSVGLAPAAPPYLTRRRSRFCRLRLDCRRSIFHLFVGSSNLLILPA